MLAIVPYLVQHPGSALAEVASEIDAAEKRIRDSVHAARLIYLEPDLDRTPATT